MLLPATFATAMTSCLARQGSVSTRAERTFLTPHHRACSISGPGVSERIFECSLARGSYMRGEHAPSLMCLLAALLLFLPRFYRSRCRREVSTH